jgi:beta-N-acetylhexosaminidase
MRRYGQLELPRGKLVKLGFNWAFGPVLDLDLNPASAVVNTRSFGSEPEKVAANGTSWIIGIQSEGLAAT